MADAAAGQHDELGRGCTTPSTSRCLDKVQNNRLRYVHGRCAGARIQTSTLIQSVRFNPPASGAGIREQTGGPTAMRGTRWPVPGFGNGVAVPTAVQADEGSPQAGWVLSAIPASKAPESPSRPRRRRQFSQSLFWRSQTCFTTEEARKPKH